MSIEDEGLNGIEMALESLVPARSFLDRDRVMYLAGQNAARKPSRERRALIALAASLAVVALGEGAMLFTRPATRIVERIIVVHEPAVIAPTWTSIPLVSQASAGVAMFLPRSQSSGSTARDLQARQVFLYGLDGLPPPPSTARSVSNPLPEPSHKTLRDELIRDLNLGDHS